MRELRQTHVIHNEHTPTFFTRYRTMKKIYTAPSLTVVSIHVERGYATSPQIVPDAKFDYGVGLSKSSANQEFSEDYSLHGTYQASTDNSNDEVFW